MVSERPAPHDVAQTGRPTSSPTRATNRVAALVADGGVSDDAGGRPAVEVLVDRLGRGEVVDVERHLIQGLAAHAVADADPDALEPGQHVELGQRERLRSPTCGWPGAAPAGRASRSGAAAR